MSQFETIKWNNQFSVGIEEIDNQHKVLFDLINRLFVAAIQREDHTVSLEILDALIDYTKTHFALEERLLQDAGYEKFEEHFAEHKVFIEKLNGMAQKFLAEEKTITFELINFLKHWLKDHIMETDMAYAGVLAGAQFSVQNWSLDARNSFAYRQEVHHHKSWWRFWQVH